MVMILRKLLGISTLALAASASTALAGTCGAPPSGWKTSRPDATQVVNVLAIHRQPEGARADAPNLTWNGSPVTQEQVREYVGITRTMNPAPTLLLIVSPSSDCAQVNVLRHMIDETLNCESGQCVEASP